MTGTLAPVPVPARRTSPWWTLLRLLGGWVLVGLLAYFLWTPGEWPVRLLAWVLLTILADEFGGWFGYIGVLLGGLPFLAPGALPAPWLVIAPLVGGALLALLLVKHSGGAFVLPFAAVIFALPLLALGRYGTKLDPTLTLPGNATFQKIALTAMLAGLAFSFVRQLVGVTWRYQARRRVRRAALAAAEPAPAAAALAEEVPVEEASVEEVPAEVITATAVPEARQGGPVSGNGPQEPGRHG
ncbi:hypothetical protein Dcar01_03583 [Deinococcus carri]|uniref:Permease n=1 Tax=Deinococcus carri TaxID=1211323 RepID=A0ABP9WF10_9DEIO